MAPPSSSSFFFFFTFFLLSLASLSSSSSNNNHRHRDVYIVYMGSREHADTELASSHNHAILASVHDGSEEAARESMIYSYVHGFRGFSAKMTVEQAAALAVRPDVAKVFRSGIRQLHTTRSWEFLGLPQNSEIGGVPHIAAHHQFILGVFDTGIWPESPSFRDDGMPPVPARWKGSCMPGENFTVGMCNRKVIGAKYYLKGMQEQVGPLISFKNGGSDVLSARDSVGHGSHTASTAAGRLVTNVSFQGLANGTARGGAPKARIAAYKVCWSPGCFDADILAAFDEAIKDGVDVLSLSLGPDAPQNDYFMDAISIGSFHAYQNGITVVGSVGNNGPSAASATNVAPWLLTVGSTSIDRDFSASVILGNNISLKGESLSVNKMKRGAELIDAENASLPVSNGKQASYCLNDTLDSNKVKGRIVVCRYPPDVSESKLAKSRVVKKAGGVGMVLIDESDRGMAVNFVIPGAIVGNVQGTEILSYMNSTRNPTAVITPAVTRVHTRPAPQVSVFSSRGPNSITPDILKPDVVAPGLNILAAWSPMGGSMDLSYNIVSGTSMSCPHVAGVALLLKAAHPSWTPAIIKSALITTASRRSNEGKAILAAPSGKRANAFDLGAGQVQPHKAQNPGLVYDSGIEDVVAFLCSSGYDTATLQLVTKDNHSTCPTTSSSALQHPFDFNYPAITISSFSTNQTVHRTLTNVESQSRIYTAIVKPPVGVDAYVVPSTLAFSSYGQKLSYAVHLVVREPSNDYVFGSLTWTNGRHKVRIPLAILT